MTTGPLIEGSDNVGVPGSSPCIERFDAACDDHERWPMLYCVLFVFATSVLLWTALVVIGHSVFAAF